MALIALLVGGFTQGVIVNLRASAVANDEARANALVVSFEESLKQLTYRSCELDDNLESLYFQDFVVFENDLPPSQRILSAPGVEVRITNVQHGCDSGNLDSGSQELSLEVAYRSATSAGNVTKLDPDPPDAPQPGFTSRLASAVSGDPIGVVILDPASTTSTVPVAEFRWDCGNGGDTTDHVSADAVDVVCNYNAASAELAFCQPPNDPTWRCPDIRLTVTDSNGATRSVSGTEPIPPPAVELSSPTVNVTASCSSQGCSGDAPFTVQFQANASVLDGRTIESYEWDFGDPLSGSANRSREANPTHTFSRELTTSGYGFQVTLRVWDNLGIPSSLDVQANPCDAPHVYCVSVTDPEGPPPTAQVACWIGPVSVDCGEQDVVSVVAETTVRFDGSGSAPAGGGSVDSYLWDFGDGQQSALPDPSHTFTTPGSYDVRLTVTSGDAPPAFVEVRVVVDAFQLPTGFRVDNVYSSWATGRFDFSWTNPPYSAGDIVTYEIEVWTESILCSGFGTKTRSVTAGPPNTFQTYSLIVDPPFILPALVCPGERYWYRIVDATRRGPVNGPFEIGPSPNQSVIA